MKQSAGILLYRAAGRDVEVLLVHPGGPFWAHKDLGSWSVPKGEFDETEDPIEAAKREFEEEVGAAPPAGDYVFLGKAKQPSGKMVFAFALEADFNLERFHSNMFEMEWPPKSGKAQEFPENDKAAWLSLTTARQKIVKGQVPLLDELAKQLGVEIKKGGGEPAQPSLF